MRVLNSVNGIARWERNNIRHGYNTSLLIFPDNKFGNLPLKPIIYANTDTVAELRKQPEGRLFGQTNFL